MCTSEFEGKKVVNNVKIMVRCFLGTDMVMLENSSKIVIMSVVSPSGVFICTIDGYYNGSFGE